MVVNAGGSSSFALPEGMQIKVPEGALDDPEARKFLEEAIRSLDENPLQKFNPHPKQIPFLSSRVKVKVYVGGVRSGKSTAGVLYDLIQLCDEEIIPAHLKAYKIWYPPTKVRIITPDFGAPLSAVLDTFKKWVPQSQLRGGSWENAWREKDRQLHFANGSMVDFMTLEQDVSKFGGVTRHVIHYDEEPEGEKGREIRTQGLGRLAEVNGEELFTFSPIHGLGWTYESFEERKGPEVSKEVWKSDAMVLVKSSIWDNPHLSREGVERALEEMPEAMRGAYESGNYTHFKGLVYDMFDPELHVIDEKEITPERVRSLLQVDCIDPGQQTQAMLFAGFDREGRLLIFDEYRSSGTSAIPANAAERYYGIREGWGLDPDPKYRFIDPAAWTRNLADGTRIDQAWREAGLTVIRAQNDLEAGCFEVMRRLDHKDAEGKPAPLIQISSRCRNLLMEIGKYRLEPKADGSFDTRKEFDHFCDCMRYIAMSKQLAKERRKARLSSRKEQRWIPGTAPAFTGASKNRQNGVSGKYS